MLFPEALQTAYKQLKLQRSDNSSHVHNPDDLKRSQKLKLQTMKIHQTATASNPEIHSTGSPQKLVYNLIQSLTIAFVSTEMAYSFPI